MGVQPLGDRGDVLADLVEFDDPQCLVGAVVLDEDLEGLRRGQVLEGQRALAAIGTPEHAVGGSEAVLLGVGGSYSSQNHVSCCEDPK